jgi:hypothetical protein
MNDNKEKQHIHTIDNNNIFHKLNTLKSWLEKYDTLVDFSIIEKFLFLFTNIFYFIPALLYGVNIITIITTLMGLVSTSFHSCQCCYPCNHKLTTSLLWCDVLFVFPAALIIVYLCRKLLPISWFLCWLLVIPIFVIAVPSIGKKLYALLHGLWHVFSGGLFIYAACVYSEHEQQKKEQILNKQKEQKEQKEQKPIQ